MDRLQIPSLQWRCSVVRRGHIGHTLSVSSFKYVLWQWFYWIIILWYYISIGVLPVVVSAGLNAEMLTCGYLGMPFLPCCVVLIAFYLPGGVDRLMIVDLTMIMCRLSTLALFVMKTISFVLWDLTDLIYKYVN